jgi:ankyrin repeat protein
MDDDYDDALIRAAGEGRLQIVQNLLQMGANINAK